MNIILELTSAFYGILIPENERKSFLKVVLDYLDQRYSIETAIVLAIKRLKMG